MRKFYRILFFAFIFIVFSSLIIGEKQKIIPVCAETTISDEDMQNGKEELRESVEKLLKTLDTKALQEYFDSLENFSDWNITDKIMELIDGGYLDYSDVFSALFSVFTSSIADMLPCFALICAIALLGGILNTVKSGFLQNSTAEIIFFVSYAAISAVLLTQLVRVFALCGNAMTDMRRQMEIILPILLTLMSASGGTVSAAVYRPAAAFLSAGISNIFTEIIFPFTEIVIILNMVSNLNRNIKLQGFIALFQSANRWLIGLSVTVFGIFLSVQGLTAASYDGMSLRAAKYAISNSVPIVGGFISGGFDLILAGSTLIKNSVGIIGVFLLVSGVLTPVVTVVGFSLVLRLAAAACESIGDERIYSFLTKASDGIGYLVASLLSVAFLYFLTIVLLICSAGVIF